MNELYFERLLELSNKASKEGEVPVSALLVCKNEIVAEAHNCRHRSNNVFEHAEIIVISDYAKRINTWHLNDCELYVTMEPCDMCKQFIMESRIKSVYYMLPRLKYKKNYYKTEFLFVQISDNIVNKYKNIVKNFWKNHR